MAYSDKSGAVSESVGLLISILVRYPEVGSINYEPKTRVLKFTFIVREALPPERIEAFRRKLKASVETYDLLTRRTHRVVTLQATTCHDLTFLEIRRDVASLTEEEITMIIGLLRQEFGASLATEPNDPLLEEELLTEENVISHMLENVREKTPDRRLIAFREEGRVLVFANRNRV